MNPHHIPTHRIIIDTDPGVDDAAAIFMALASPKLEVLGITAVAGNVALADTVTNACKIVALTDQNIPVFAGAAGPLIRDQVYGKYAAIGAFSDDLVPATDVQPQQRHAVHFIVDTARDAAKTGDLITICAVGPLTNIALALRLDPSIAAGIKQIVTMGGAYTALGHRTPWAEFNVYADPHAAEIVYQSGIPLVVMPLDVTFKALFEAEHIHDMLARGGKPGQALFNLLTAFDRNDEKRLGRLGAPIHDAMTIAFLLQPELYTTCEAAIGVELSGKTKGHTYADFYGKTDMIPNAVVASDIDESGYRNLLLDRLARFGSEIVANVPRGAAKP